MKKDAQEVESVNSTSIADALKEAFDAQMADSDNDTQTHDAQESEVNKEIEANQDTQSGDDQPLEAATEEPNNDSTESVSVQPPEHWAAADKDVFNSIEDSKLKEWVIGRHNQMEADYTNQKKDLSNFVSEYEPVDKIISSLRPMMAKHNVNTQQMIGVWAQTQQDLLYKPKETLLSLAKEYNVDLSDAVDAQEPAEIIDPDIKRLNDQISGLQNQLQTVTQNSQQTELDTWMGKIQNFAEEKDESGNLKNIYFNDVMPDMISQANIMKSQGLNPNLAELYESATWSNKAVREKILASQQQADADKRAEQARVIEEKKRAQIQSAKRASKSVSGQGVGSAQTASGSITDTLWEAYNQSVNQ